MSNTYDLLMVPVDRVDDIIPYDNQIVMKIQLPTTKAGKLILMTGKGQSRELASRIIGKVLKVGPNVVFCEVGDEVIFAKYAGVVVARMDDTAQDKSDGFEIRIIDEKNLIARLAHKETKGA